jgi:hypothetical protein
MYYRARSLLEYEFCQASATQNSGYVVNVLIDVRPSLDFAPVVPGGQASRASEPGLLEKLLLALAAAGPTDPHVFPVQPNLRIK